MARRPFCIDCGSEVTSFPARMRLSPRREGIPSSASVACGPGFARWPPGAALRVSDPTWRELLRRPGEDLQALARPNTAPR